MDIKHTKRKNKMVKPLNVSGTGLLIGGAIAMGSYVLYKNITNAATMGEAQGVGSIGGSEDMFPEDYPIYNTTGTTTGAAGTGGGDTYDSTNLTDPTSGLTMPSFWWEDQAIAPTTITTDEFGQGVSISQEAYDKLQSQNVADDVVATNVTKPATDILKSWGFIPKDTKPIQGATAQETMYNFGFRPYGLSTDQLGQGVSTKDNAGLWGTGMSGVDIALGTVGASGSYASAFGSSLLKTGEKDIVKGGIESIPIAGKSAVKFMEKGTETVGKIGLKSVAKTGAKIGISAIPIVGTVAGAEFDTRVSGKSRWLSYPANIFGDILGGIGGVAAAPFGGVTGVAVGVGGQIAGEQIVYGAANFVSDPSVKKASDGTVYIDMEEGQKYPSFTQTSTSIIKNNPLSFDLFGWIGGLFSGNDNKNTQALTTKTGSTNQKVNVQSTNSMSSAASNQVLDYVMTPAKSNVSSKSKSGTTRTTQQFQSEFSSLLQSETAKAIAGTNITIRPSTTSSSSKSSSSKSSSSSSSKSSSSSGQRTKSGQKLPKNFKKLVPAYQRRVLNS